MNNTVVLVLNSEDYQLLIDLFPMESGFDYLYSNVIEKSGGRKHLRLSRRQNEVLIDSLFDHYLSNGLTLDKKANAVGLVIQSLIEKVSKHLYN